MLRLGAVLFLSAFALASPTRADQWYQSPSEPLNLGIPVAEPPVVVSYADFIASTEDISTASVAPDVVQQNESETFTSIEEDGGAPEERATGSIAAGTTAAMSESTVATCGTPEAAIAIPEDLFVFDPWGSWAQSRAEYEAQLTP